MGELLVLLLIVLVFALHRHASQRIAALAKEIEAIKADLRGLARPPALSTAAEPAVEPAAAEIAAREETVEEEAAEPQPSHVSAEPVPQQQVPQQHWRENFESHIGARWPVWVGGVALALGGLFLVRFTIEAGLIGPRTRLILAALFGLLLAGTGEALRRRLLTRISERFGNALIPGALTGAGAVTLIGAAYAAHAIYGFITAPVAFTSMAAISLATIALSLLHGQALAGLGLVASLVTPLLVASEAPNIDALFAFLTLVWLAVSLVARLNRWITVPMLANIGIGLWAFLYVAASPAFDPLPPALMLIAALAGTIVLWPGRHFDADRTGNGGWDELLARPPLGITLSMSLTALLPALTMLRPDAIPGGVLPLFAFGAIIACLAALGASRRYTIWPALISAAGAVAGIALLALQPLIGTQPAGSGPVEGQGGETMLALGLGAIFTLLGLGFLNRLRHGEPQFARIWAVLAFAVPVTLSAISFLNFGLLSRDWPHGLHAIGLGLVLLAASEWLRRDTGEDDDPRPADLLGIGSFAAFTLALHVLTNGIATTILVPLAGFAYLLASRIRPRASLSWAMAAALGVFFLRVAWEPTLVGPDSLGRTPFLNALLTGYGIPTLLAVLSAWLMRDRDGEKLLHVLQALAAIAVFVTLTVLLAHAINGGVLDSHLPTLGEQSVYTLLTIGFSAVLTGLDGKAPSPVFRWGSIIAGIVTTLNVLVLHVFALNPYFSGENTGPWPFANLLLVGYLLPALAYGIAAYGARGRRPAAYVGLLAVTSAALAFLYATLAVRRIWQGENIADWKGFLQGETYSYSVVWLLIGVGLLVLGSRFNARSLRLASAGLVLISVIKVFLFDMANLEGILRALSFIGLGVVLIGIGLFYQRILTRRGTLAEFLTASPLRGANIDLDRQRDGPRDPTL